MSFCTVINCMDGRIQLPVIGYLKDRFGVKYVDCITEAGPVGILAMKPSSILAKSIFRRVDISINAHSSQDIAIVAHHDCAGNPVTDFQHKRQLQLCIEVLSKRYPNAEVVGLWLDSDWSIVEY